MTTLGIAFRNITFIFLAVLVAYVSYLDLIKKGSMKASAIKKVLGFSVGLVILGVAFVSTEFGRHVTPIIFKSIINFFFHGLIS